MINELRKKSQITLPKEIVKDLNLLEGDKLEVNVVNGVITLEPESAIDNAILVLRIPICRSNTNSNL